jgi:hypothetical protein
MPHPAFRGSGLSGPQARPDGRIPEAPEPNYAYGATAIHTDARREPTDRGIRLWNQNREEIAPADARFAAAHVCLVAWDKGLSQATSRSGKSLP